MADSQKHYYYYLLSRSATSVNYGKISLTLVAERLSVHDELVRRKRMKRPLLVLVLALGILGTLAIYSRFLAYLPNREHQSHDLITASGEFAIELSLSCDVAADPFELDQTTSLLVRFAGEDLIHRKEPVVTTEAIRIDNIKNIQVGKNAFFVKAIPVAENITHPNAARIRILRDHLLIAEQTLWSAAGESIEGEIVVNLPAETAGQP